ncbi:hypothetical protein MycrhN_0902 [Mycolicibacterium rhodesiae NBB3]|uniref:Uncharacterized protein n=1 Tax=Mycolicibacterium rhodesiae (strain NBB3) TaxID=710685 RepID=G8RSR0_MYCRN|nr:hypothetical protein [Mycolicibacterium rhodesiae]AEV71532.1 hypothetical protein MycrhN_0902 [Mycolicibacterium rhodesiae NBB3]
MIGDIANIATAIAVLLAAGGLWAQTRARKFELALVYVQQYWKIEEDLAREGPLSAATPNGYRYLRLCEDEFDAARQGWIDISIWRIWHDGMRSELKVLHPDQLTKFEQLHLCMTGAEGHSPTACPGLHTPGLRRKVSWWFERLLGS